jgi:hypothetical protein
MWLLIKNILVKLFVYMCMSSWVAYMVLIVMSIALSFALKMLCYFGSLFDSWMLLLGL